LLNYCSCIFPAAIAVPNDIKLVNLHTVHLKMWTYFAPCEVYTLYCICSNIFSDNTYL